MSYKAPIRDILFSLQGAGRFGRLADAFPDADADTVQAILTAAGDFAADVVGPLNQTADREGARYENGRVTAPAGFVDAYRQFSADGWNGLAAAVEHGGQGLPKTLEVAIFDMIQAANLAFGIWPTLTLGAIEAIDVHGSERQKALYLPKLVTGEWPGTMNLTEPQAGSDLAALRTRAEPDGEGGYKLYGQKIFITWGDQDATDNILHLVLARLPDAPEGVKGISLFLAPKVLVNEDGSMGGRNDLRVGGIEHKMGLHGSPTCVMLYEGAKAELVGQPHNGLAAMFTMMNAARLMVGVQGVGIAERAYQRALEFSQERRQGRSAWTGENYAPIFDHPDVRRTLMLSKAKIEAARGLCFATGVCADLGRASADPAEREAAKAREALLTPIAKAWSTDVGVDVASACLQVHGGMGFIEETGAAQHYRDARIMPIYEGTNGIQAIDLAGRKLADGGAAMGVLLAELRQEAQAWEGDLAGVKARLLAGADAVETATAWLIEKRGTPDALAGATPFLRLAGDVIGGWMLARGAVFANANPGSDDAAWRASKTALARLFAEQVLTGAAGLAEAVKQGAGDLAETSADTLGV
ncbi:MAG: acyl-CoA dehydrogenase [Caulobacterales bacterium 68-7]|nr:MAG: acyl-CoA dehydrogenase [Caulobacterales bacterium 68-7]